MINWEFENSIVISNYLLIFSQDVISSCILFDLTLVQDKQSNILRNLSLYSNLPGVAEKLKQQERYRIASMLVSNVSSILMKWKSVQLIITKPMIHISLVIVEINT